MKRLALCFILVVLVVAGCSLPNVDDINGKKPIMITNEPGSSELQRLGCILGIQATGAGAIATWRELNRAEGSDTGLAYMLNNDGTLAVVNVRSNWRKIAGYAGITALNAAVTADQCRYTLFAGQSITYWCGAGERIIHKWDRFDDAANPVQMNPQDYDFFFNSGYYVCWNGWAYTKPPDPPGYCWALPCIMEK